MRKLKLAALAALFASCALADGPLSVASNVRLATDGRVWQVALRPSDPITWRWPDWATAAKLSATSYVGNVVTTLDIARGADEAFGSWTIPTAVNGFSESIHDVTIELLKGEKTYETRSARFVVLPGVAGGAVDVLAATDEKATKVDKVVRLMPYSAEWAGAGAAEAASLELTAGSEIKTIPLAGTSGWHPFLAKAAFSGLSARGGAFSLTLGFDGVASSLVADLYWQTPGFLLLFK